MGVAASASFEMRAGPFPRTSFVFASASPPIALSENDKIAAKSRPMRHAPTLRQRVSLSAWPLRICCRSRPAMTSTTKIAVQRAVMTGCVTKFRRTMVTKSCFPSANHEFR